MEKGSRYDQLSMAVSDEQRGSPELVGRSFAVGGYTRFQNMSNGSSRSRFGLNNILSLDLDFDTINENYYAAQEMIRLCRATYRRVPIFKTAIDIMADLSNTLVHLKGGSVQSKQFFEGWFKRINLFDLKSQFFKELFLGGNVFYYRVDATMTPAQVIKLNKSYARVGASVDIPTKYIMIDAANVCVLAIAFDLPCYYKILNRLELEQIKHSEDTNEQLSYINIKDAINAYTVGNGQALIKLEPEQVHAIFYNKMDYEPMAIPMGFSVLNDINLLLEMKRADSIIASSVEYTLLLITNGAKKEEGGINPNTINSIKTMFKNETVSRVMVADYTTKAEFIIPDLNKILTPAKYDEINKTIANGLMNIFFGEQKYTDSVTKVRALVKKLTNAQELFLNEFLNKEIRRISLLMNFKSYPTAYMEPIQMEDQTNLQRVYAQLLTLGILSPKDGLELFESGLFPSYDELMENQKEYKQDRDKGLFQPMQGGPFSQLQMTKVAGDIKTQQIKAAPQGQAGRPNNTPSKQTTKKVSQVGASEDVSIATAEEQVQFSQVKGVENAIRLDKVKTLITDKYKEFNNIKRLSHNHKESIQSLASLITKNESPELWETKYEQYVTNTQDFPPKIDRIVEIENIKNEFDVDNDTATILYWSKL